jgi:hypothetical protein
MYFIMTGSPEYSAVAERHHEGLEHHTAFAPKESMQAVGVW